MGAKNEIYAKGIAEGLVASLSEEEISCGERFEELVSLIVDTADVSEDIARYYADRIWERKKRRNDRRRYASDTGKTYRSIQNVSQCSRGVIPLLHFSINYDGINCI